MNHSRARDLLSVYLEHDLAEAVRQDLEAHLCVCASCSAELRDLRDAIELLRRLPDPEPPPFLSTRVMARIAAGEGRLPVWRRWLEPFGTPLMAASLAAAAAALAVFSFAAPRAGIEVAENSAIRERAGEPPYEIVNKTIGPSLPVQFAADPRWLAHHLRGASHPHSIALAEQFDDPVRAVAYQPR